jgi:hypothetical protein
MNVLSMCTLASTISLTSEWHSVRQTIFFKIGLETSRVRLGLGQGLGPGLELVFGVGLVLVKPLLCYVLSLWG